MDKIQEQNEIIRSAQWRKGLSISYFNSLNSAISLCSGMDVNKKETINKIIELRDFFLENYKKYYAKVIENIGQNYSAEETIEKLKTATSLEELKSLWVGLSADERQDKTIIEEVNNLKKSYE